MSDPVVEASLRAAKDMRPHDVHATRLGDAEKGAREALRVIQVMWRKHIGNDKITYHQRCHAIATDLAELIFNDDELEGGVGE